MKNILFLALLLLIGLFQFSCNRNGDANYDALAQIELNGDLPSDFTKFYMRFHIDSIYQMQHIIFPLSGLPSNADSTALAGRFEWQQEDWVLHRAFGGSEDYEQQFLKINDNTITEFITEVNAGFGMERRFSKLSGTWYLIYYAGMNKVVQRE